TLARPYLAATTTPQVIYALLEVQPTAVVAQVRMPVNVCFVLDRSGSMKGEKIERVRQATSMAVDRLDTQDIAAVVIFDHRTEVLVPAGPVNDRRAFKERVARIRDAGGTKIAPALEKALVEIQKDRRGAIRRLVLLTDGQTENEDECLRRAEDAGRLGVPVTALGVGKDWNEDLLIEMANRSGGTADYIARPDEITEYFQNTVQKAQNAVIQNTNLSLRLVTGVTPRAVWQVTPLINNLGYKPISDRDVSVPLGELETGQGRTLLVELLVDPRPAGSYRVGQVEIVYDVPALGLTGGKSKVDLLLTFTADQGQLSQVNPGVMNIVEKVSAFKLQTRALQDLSQGDVQGATQKLKSAVTRLLSQGELDLAETMQQEITNLEQNGQLSSEGQKTIKFQGRKTVRLSDIDLPKE
ncbi:MAG: VWA domain-containing protein, partial [Chloroflexales bacterium]